MRRIVTLIAGMAVLALCAGNATAAPGPELLYNTGLESSGGTTPLYWMSSAWGNLPGDELAFSFSYPTGGAHTGDRSVRVDVANYKSGDAKWIPSSTVAVTGGKYYTFSDWYKSNATTAVSVYYETASDPVDGGTWANLFSGIAPSSDWKQYTTGFTMPAGAVRAYFAHFIPRNGYLQTDDYSLKETDPPAGYAHPIVSLTFDDGSEAFYQTALPLLNARGYKTTQYIPTADLVAGDPYVMTKEQIRGLQQAGHEIGSHSVTHPDLTTVTDEQLRSELVDSKNQLEAITGPGTVVNFAYPFGTYDARVIQFAEDAGYRSGRSVETGYNGKGDLEPFDIHVQNMTPAVTITEFRSWVDYAKAHNYWLTIVYHEVVPDGAPVCTDPETVSPCLGPYDTTVTNFTAQLAYIASAGLGPDVMTVQQALNLAMNHAPAAGTVKIAPASPTTKAVVTATPTGFSDGDADTLAYHYQWLVGDEAVAGATTDTFDLSASGHGDRGDRVSVQVYATDDHEGTSATVSDTVTVANIVPDKGSVSISPTAPLVGETLTATADGFSDGDGDALHYAYAWYRNDQLVPGAVSDTLTLLDGKGGDAIRVEVRALDDGGGVSDAASATVVLTGTGDVGPSPTPLPTPIPNVKPDKTAPKVIVTSPKHKTYKLGSRLSVRFSCTDASGIARYKATLERAGTKKTVHEGTKVRLSHRGTYVLRIVATDKKGNSITKLVRFSVR